VITQQVNSKIINFNPKLMAPYIHKNIAILFSLSLLSNIMVGCGTNNSEKKTEPAVEDTTIQEGRNLVSQSDCLGCHKEDGKLVGPSYVEIANYYTANEANIEMLADKIVKGGKGSWGDIPMAPHPNISTQDAQKMATYILSLKK